MRKGGRSRRREITRAGGSKSYGMGEIKSKGKDEGVGGERGQRHRLKTMRWKPARGGVWLLSALPPLPVAASTRAAAATSQRTTRWYRIAPEVLRRCVFSLQASQ